MSGSRAVVVYLQIDFFARDEMITIVPNFSIPTGDKSIACIMVCLVWFCSVWFCLCLSFAAAAAAED